MYLRRTTVTRITRLVFLVWLMLTVGLLWEMVRRSARPVPGHQIDRTYEYNEIDPSDASVKGGEDKRSPPIDNER